MFATLNDASFWSVKDVEGNQIDPLADDEICQSTIDVDHFGGILSLRSPCE